MATDTPLHVSPRGEEEWTPRTLRVGVLVDGLVQPAWIRAVIEVIRGSGIAETAFVGNAGCPTALGHEGGKRGCRTAAWRGTRTCS